jgi:transcriptional regulator with XRE-family HTH domain
VNDGPATLKRWRRDRGVSQHALAVAVGLTAGAISQFERGVHVPRRRVVEAIDAHLDAYGELHSAFGYGGTTETLAALSARVDALAAEVERLRQAVDAAGGVGGCGI